MAEAMEWAKFGMVAVIFVIGFVVMALLLDAFKTTTISCDSGYTYNSSANNCYLSTNASVQTGLSYAGNVTDGGRLFVNNTSSQLPTAGTILGVSLLLVIIGGIGYFGYQKYRGSR